MQKDMLKAIRVVCGCSSDLRRHLDISEELKICCFIEKNLTAIYGLNIYNKLGIRAPFLLNRFEYPEDHAKLIEFIKKEIRGQ